MSNVPQPIEHDLGGYISKAFDIYKQDLVNWIIIGVVGTFALGVGFLGGFHICAMKALSGQKPEIGDVLAPFNRIGEWILPILGLSAVAILLGWVCGLGIFIAIYFSLLWMWAWPLMYSQNQTWAQAKENSTALVKSALVPNFILMFVAGLVGGIGGIVGLNFLTAPLTGIILALAYQAQFGGAGGHGGHGGPAALPGQGYGGPAPGAWGAPPAAAQVKNAWGAPPAAPADNNNAWGAPPAAPVNNAWGAPAPTPAPDNNNAWGAPPAAAPVNNGWGAPAPTPAPDNNNNAWGAPPAAAPAPTPWGSSAPAAAPAPTPWGAPAPTAAPADNNNAWGAPQAAAPAPTPWGAPAPTPTPPAEDIENATQSTTNNPDEIVSGKTMAMSTLDFEKMLAERNKPNS